MGKKNIIYTKLCYCADALVLQRGQDFFAYTLKKGLPFALFLTYHALKSPEGIICRTNLAERFKIGYF